MGSMLWAWMTNISNWHFAAISIDSSFSSPFEFCRFLLITKVPLLPVVFIDSWQSILIGLNRKAVRYLSPGTNRKWIIVSDKQIQIFRATKALKIVNSKLMPDSQIFQVTWHSIVRNSFVQGLPFRSIWTVSKILHLFFLPFLTYGLKIKCIQFPIKTKILPLDNI